MRFLSRTLWACLILAACFGVLALGVQRYAEARRIASEERPSRPAPERIFTIRDLVLQPATVTPVISAYGTVEAGRVLELRAAQPGRIVDLISGFGDGAEITSGAVLMRIDPAQTRSREDDARAALLDARSKAQEAQQSATLAEAELETAMRQLGLRRTALQRQQQLVQRRVAAANTIEAEQLSVAAAEQTVIARQQALAAARNRIEQTRLAIDRADISLQTARRDVAETDIRAPFSGVLSESNAALGRLVSTNESLGKVIDLGALEAVFRLTDAQFSRVLAEDGRLMPLNATVSLKLGQRSIEAEATLMRGAAVAGPEGGRKVYASIRGREGLPMRPGDFVSIRLQEPQLEGIAELPARAITEDGRIFVINDDNRLEPRQVSILRRTGESVIIGDVPFGSRIVAELRAQLGPGIKVQTAAEAEAAAAKARERRAKRFGGGKPGGKAGKQVGKPGGKPGETKSQAPGGDDKARPEGRPEGSPQAEGSTGGARPANAGSRPQGAARPAEARPNRDNPGNRGSGA